MTPLVRLYIKTSFAFLLLGLALGGYITVEVNLLGRAVAWPVITAHVHLVLVGFMLMLVFGVATWMFPRSARDGGRYRPGLAWLVYWLLTGTTLVRVLGVLAAAAAGTRGSWQPSADSVSLRRPTSSSPTCGPASACPEGPRRPRRDGGLEPCVTESARSVSPPRSLRRRPSTNRRSGSCRVWPWARW